MELVPASVIRDICLYVMNQCKICMIYILRHFALQNKTSDVHPKACQGAIPLKVSTFIKYHSLVSKLWFKQYLFLDQITYFNLHINKYQDWKTSLSAYSYPLL